MWYVYDKNTTIIQRTCRTAKTAKAWITRRQNQFLRDSNLYVSNDGPLFDWGFAEAQYFHDHIEKTRTVRSLMTGAPVTLSANTPRACDPSTELYWTM